MISWLCIGCKAPSAPQTADNEILNQPLTDPVTTEVVVNLRKAVVFYRAQPALSSVARDYLYLGPVQTNNSGTQELSLWVGLASTIDRGYLRESQPTGDELVVIIDGAKLRLPLIPWIHDQDHNPFPTPIALAAALRAPISQQQLARIAQAKTLEVALASEATPALRFQHWEGQWLAWQKINLDTRMGIDVKVSKLEIN